MRDGTLQVDHQVRSLHHRHHQVEKSHVSLEIPLRKIPLFIVVGDEYIDALEDCPVLDYHIIRLGYLHEVLETLLEEIYLKVERPSLDILVVILQVWVICDSLVFRGPSIIIHKHSRQSGLPCTDISGNTNEHSMYL